MKKILTLASATLLALSLQAEDFSLYYDTTSTGAGITELASVAELQKITFENGTIVLTKKDGTTVTVQSSLAQRLFFSTKEAVGINAPSLGNAKAKAIYDLTGRKINAESIGNLPKGTYIVDGKKVYVNPQIGH